MTHEPLSRLMAAAEAIGMLTGLVNLGKLDDMPGTKQAAIGIIKAWDDTFPPAREKEAA